jgi:hypothetical protein
MTFFGVGFFCDYNKGKCLNLQHTAILTLDQSYTSRGMSQVTKNFKREAIIAVFARLGDENLTMLMHSLRAAYKIDFERDDTFTLEELQIALQRVLGANGAGLLIREIHNEMRLLAAA